ncbi:MAG: hypothetical protein M1836_004060 [Candelina mexicana]|nr:MAG: hypothetical protein M1836_004060 [Candelina mexicana]
MDPTLWKKSGGLKDRAGKRPRLPNLPNGAQNVLTARELILLRAYDINDETFAAITANYPLQAFKNRGNIGGISNDYEIARDKLLAAYPDLKEWEERMMTARAMTRRTQRPQTTDSDNEETTEAQEDPVIEAAAAEQEEGMAVEQDVAMAEGEVTEGAEVAEEAALLDANELLGHDYRYDEVPAEACLPPPEGGVNGVTYNNPLVNDFIQRQDAIGLRLFIEHGYAAMLAMRNLGRQHPLAAEVNRRLIANADLAVFDDEETE